MSSEPTVFVIDDDVDIRESLKALLSTMRLRVETFPTVRKFLSEFDPTSRGCVVADIHMPRGGGLELQDELRRTQCSIPIIMMAGHADIPATVRAVKRDAFDVLEKPFDGSVFVDRVREAITLDTQRTERQ